jgi:drug/metabolite transporter (DMT)-like permease
MARRMERLGFMKNSALGNGWEAYWRLVEPLTLIEMTVNGFPTTMDSHALLLGVIAAVIPGFAAYQAYSFVQSELGAAKAGIMLYLGPLYGALTGYLFLREQSQLFHFVGAALILPGVYFATKE